MNRAEQIKTLTAKRNTLETELNALGPRSRAQRAIELRDEIAKLSVRIDMHQKKLARETVVENSNGEVKIDVQEEAMNRLRDAYENFMAALGVTSTKRKVVAWFVSMLACFGVGYLVGSIMEMLILAAVAYTGSVLLMVLIYVIGIMFAIYSGVKLGNAVYRYITDGVIDAHWNKVKTGVANFFTPKLQAA